MISAAFLLRVAIIASLLPRKGRGSKSGADEIHWTVTALTSMNFD
jgi:hypothetical protein